MDEFIKLISTVGFPIAVTTFLLLKIQPAINDLTKAITKLIEHIDKIAKNGENNG